MAKKGSSMGSLSSKGSKGGSSNWLLYVVVALGIVLVVALGYLLFSGKCFERFTNETSPKLVYYYMKECPHCKDFNPVWDSLSAKLTAENLVVDLQKVDLQDEKNKDLVKDISGAPTIMFVTSTTTAEYDGSRSAEEIIAFLKKKTTTSD